MPSEDCPIGARHEVQVQELSRRVTTLEATVQKTCEAVSEHVTIDATRRATLDTWSKVAIILGPALAGVVTWFVTHYEDAGRLATAVSTAAGIKQ